MTAMRKIEIELSEDVAAEIDAKVATGAYADPAAYVVESVETYLQDQDPEIERWLLEEVVPTLERIDREGSTGLSAEQVFGRARERYLARQERV